MHKIYLLLSDVLKVDAESFSNIFEYIVVMWVFAFFWIMANATVTVGAPDGSRAEWDIWSGHKWRLVYRVAAVLAILRLLLHVVLRMHHFDYYYDVPVSVGMIIVAVIYFIIVSFSLLTGGFMMFAIPVAAAIAFFVIGFLLDAVHAYDTLGFFYILPPLVSLIEAIVLLFIKPGKEIMERTRQYHEIAPKYEHYVDKPLTSSGVAMMEQAQKFLEDAQRAQKDHPEANVTMLLPVPQAGVVEITNEQYRAELVEAWKYERRGIDVKIFGVEYMPDAKKKTAPFDCKKAVAPVFQALNWHKEPTAEEYQKLYAAVSTYAFAHDQMLNKATQQMKEELAVDWEIIDRGCRGEQIAFAAAEKLTRHFPTVRILENYRIETERGSAESDLVLITPAGVICVEVKNYGEGGAYSLLIQNDGSWYKNYGTQVHAIDGNPFAQNTGHVAALRAVFGEELRAMGAKVQPLVMVPNDVMVENLSPYEVIHAEALPVWMDRQPEILTAEQIDRIWTMMKERALPPLPFKQKDYLGWQQMLRDGEETLFVLCEILAEIRLSEKYRK